MTSCEPADDGLISARDAIGMGRKPKVIGVPSGFRMQRALGLDDPPSEETVMRPKRRRGERKPTVDNSVLVS